MQTSREAGLKVNLPHGRRLRLWWRGFEVSNSRGGRVYQFPWSRWFWADTRIEWLMAEVTRLRQLIEIMQLFERYSHVISSRYRDIGKRYWAFAD